MSIIDPEEFVHAWGTLLNSFTLLVSLKPLGDIPYKISLRV